MSLILNLQTWSGDQPQGMALARLLADIEDTRREDVVFMFTWRYDSIPDHVTMDYVRRKFKRTVSHRTTRHGSGWPAGPNAMFSDSYQYCIENTRNGTLRGVDGILFMEADCVPLNKNWINLLKEEWESCKASGKQVMGCWLEAGDCGVKHINGNCIIHKDFWRDHKGILNPASGGWDAINAAAMMPLGHPSKLIFSDYHLGVAGYNDWKGCEYLWQAKQYRDPVNPLYGKDVFPVWLHGPKAGQGLDCAREKLVTK